MFPGQLDFDHEGDFLADHGFRDLFLKQDDLNGPTNGDLLKNATSWIRTHFQSPFFLALWTEDTHHPYFAADSCMTKKCASHLF